MTNKEIQTIIDSILLQVNQAFERSDEKIAKLEERVLELEVPKAAPKAPRKKAA